MSPRPMTPTCGVRVCACARAGVHQDTRAAACGGKLGWLGEREVEQAALLARLPRR
jgi:hypothetical protein